MFTSVVDNGLFGPSVSEETTISGYELSDWSLKDQLRIPLINPFFRFSQATFDTLNLWWSFGRKTPLYISGPTGSGKTSSVLEWAARTNIPVVSVTVRPRMDKRELIGRYVLGPSGQMQWIDGPVSLAYRNGWLLLINEFTAAPPELWVSCNDILEGANIDNEATGEVIERHPRTRIAITDNTRGGESDALMAGYLGRQRQDRSVLDRFWHLRMQPLSKEVERDILIESTEELILGRCDRASQARICEILANLRSDSLTKTQDVVGFEKKEIAISYRTIERMRDLCFHVVNNRLRVGDESALWVAKTALTESLDAVEREAIETMVKTHLGLYLNNVKNRLLVQNR